MYNKEFALKIKKKVDKEKVLLVSDESDYILGFRVLKYYYSDEEEMEKHSETMCQRGGYSVTDIASLPISSGIRVIVGEYEKNCYEGVK